MQVRRRQNPRSISPSGGSAGRPWLACSDARPAACRSPVPWAWAAAPPPRWPRSRRPATSSWSAGPGLEEQLRGLAEREHGCCRFLSLEVKRAGDQLIWEARADDSATALLDELWQLPARLRAEPRPGHDVAALYRAGRAAGLAFS